jgi:hypothetical protein
MKPINSKVCKHNIYNIAIVKDQVYFKTQLFHCTGQNRTVLLPPHLPLLFFSFLVQAILRIAISHKSNYVTKKQREKKGGNMG